MRGSFPFTSILSGLLFGCLISVSPAQNALPFRRPIPQLCLTILAALRPVAMQETSKTSLPLSSDGAFTAINDKATLPDGVTVELLGITDEKPIPSSKQARWWKSDGTLLASPLYSPTVVKQIWKGRQDGFIPNLTFSLKVTGISAAEPSFTQRFTPGALTTSGAVNSLVPHTASYIIYEAEARFSKNPAVASLRFKFAHEAWQTVATATTLPTVVHTPDGATVRFGKPDKQEAGVAKIGTVGKASELAVIVRAENNQPVSDVARRVTLTDDQGNTILLNSSDALSYDGQQKGQAELHLLIAVPEKLRGHIRQYALQTRAYQFVDFPNIHLKPTEAKK